MFFRVFEQVLSRHLDKVAGVADYPGMYCVSRTNYEDKANRGDGMSGVFKVCRYITFSNGEAITVGAALGIEEKAKKIAQLLDYCGEDREVFRSDSIKLPEASTRKGASTITYKLYGKEYTDTYTDMMVRVFEQVLTRHQDVVASLPSQSGMSFTSKLNYGDPKNRTSKMPNYFRVCRNITFDNGESICIGTAAITQPDKLKKISLLLDYCGESRDVFQAAMADADMPKPDAKLGRPRNRKSYDD